MSELFNNICENTLLVGLAAFLGKIWSTRIAAKEQAKLEAQLEAIKSELEQARQKLNARLQKSVIVHQIQFEKEFQVYQELVKALVSLRKFFFSLNHTLRPIHDNPEKAKAYWTDKSKDFVDSYYSFCDVVDMNKPFYADTVNRAAESLAGFSLDEVMYRSFFGSEVPHPNEEAKQMKTVFLTHTNSIIDAIRDRIRSLEVMN